MGTVKMDICFLWNESFAVNEASLCYNKKNVVNESCFTAILRVFCSGTFVRSVRICIKF